MKIYNEYKNFKPIVIGDNGYTINFEYKEIDSNNGTWTSVHVPKRNILKHDIKLVIEKEINRQITEKIVNEFYWKNMQVSLKQEDQINYSAIYSVVKNCESILPLTYKFTSMYGNTDIYYTFESADDFENFYASLTKHINDCLNEGWARKDAIDYAAFEY